jgi:hypothetical protein
MCTCFPRIEENSNIACVKHAAIMFCRFQAMNEARAAREAAQQQQNFYRNFDNDPYSNSSSSGGSSRRNRRGGYKNDPFYIGSSSGSSSDQDALLGQTADGSGDGGGGKFGGGGRRGNERQDLVRKVMGKHTPTQEQVCVRHLPAFSFAEHIQLQGTPLHVNEKISSSPARVTRRQHVMQSAEKCEV